MNDAALLRAASRKLKLSRAAAYCASSPENAYSAASDCIRSCLSGRSDPARSNMGVAMLIGLAPAAFGWDLQEFVEASRLGSEQEVMAALQLLAVEYDDDGINERFRSVIQGSLCIIGAAGKATQQSCYSLGLGAVPLGGCVGKLDCHVGGVPGSCSERAACIQHAPSETSVFQFSCVSEDDIVTLNGRKITPDTGTFPLFNEDICSVGARVFVFITPRECCTSTP
jgi:hypothetical protein